MFSLRVDPYFFVKGELSVFEHGCQIFVELKTCIREDIEVNK